jgi:DNA repair protein RecO (recombination protein O)
MSFNAEGLIVKETSYGDNDKILTVLMRGKGKMQLWARGCKRIKSPLLSVAHTFTYAQFSVAESKGSYSIRSAQIIDNFYSLRENLERLALAEYIAEIAGRCVIDNEESDGVL